MNPRFTKGDENTQGGLPREKRDDGKEFISVILPCLNEEGSIGVCVKKIKDVFSREGITGEIIVVDNGSTDRSEEIAREQGARVIYELNQGYGAAYLAGLKEAKGKYIIMGDADDTYNFYDIPKFIKLLRKGYDFVLGSRFKGGMQKNAMPILNRYVGNPILSGMCRLFFHTKLSDIHCGMRALARDAYEKMNLKCPGMEFATEMVVVALQEKLKITELPIEYFPRKGESKLNPLKDAWRHIRFMLLFCPTWLYLLPGGFLTLFGLFVLLLLLKGPFYFLGHHWDIHMMVLGSLLGLFGFQLLNIGVFAKAFAVRQGFLKEDRIVSSLMNFFTLETGIMIGTVLFIIGLGMNMAIFIEWWGKMFGELHRIREAILAMTLMIIGLQIVFSSFFISLLTLER